MLARARQTPSSGWGDRWGELLFPLRRLFLRLLLEGYRGRRRRDWRSGSHQFSCLQVDGDGVPDGGSAGRCGLEDKRQRLGVGFDREIAEIDDRGDFEHVIADPGSGGGFLSFGSGGGKSATSGDDVGRFLAARGCHGARETLIKVRVAGKNSIGPQAGRFATRINVFLNSDRTAVFGVGR